MCATSGGRVRDLDAEAAVVPVVDGSIGLVALGFVAASTAVVSGASSHDSMGPAVGDGILVAGWVSLLGSIVASFACGNSGGSCRWRWCGRSGSCLDWKTSGGVEEIGAMEASLLGGLEALEAGLLVAFEVGLELGPGAGGCGSSFPR